MNLITLVPKPATADEFVDFWSPLYFYKPDDDDVYDNNMKRPLTPDKAMRLFEWKNGKKLSRAKEASVRRHFIESSQPLPTGDDHTALIGYLAQDTGGVIFRIFWLHCNHPETFPIFDRYAYRAMRHILSRDKPAELANQTYKKQAELYVHHYRPFFNDFCHDSAAQENAPRSPVSDTQYRDLDRALWAFGKFLEMTYGAMMSS